MSLENSGSCPCFSFLFRPWRLRLARRIPRPRTPPRRILSVSIETDRGKIEIELYATEAPRTVENFLQYVRSGYYDGIVFDRVEPNFLIEAGGRGADGSIRASFLPIPSEAANGLKNLAGTVGLARESDPGSGANYFYVNLKDNPHLDHTGDDPAHYGYTVFGRVISGMETVGKIAETPKPSAAIVRARVEREPDRRAVIATKERTFEDLSEYYNIDKVYRSMTGPQSTRRVSLEPGAPELLWIVGYSADVVGDAGDPSGLDQFMCHSNLDLDAGEHLRRLQMSHDVNPRLFTLSQGQMDIEFPPGFGISMISDEKLSLTTQVLNLNYPDCGLSVRHRTRIRYVRDRDLPFAMTPLFEDTVYRLEVLSATDGRYGSTRPPTRAPTWRATCTGQTPPGMRPPTPTTGLSLATGRRSRPRSATGRRWTQCSPSQDTTIHYIAVPPAPLAESLELSDKTADTGGVEEHGRNPPDRIGLRASTRSRAKKGSRSTAIAMQLISTYNDTSKRKQDSMAVIFLYLGPRLQKPQLAPPSCEPVDIARFPPGTNALGSLATPSRRRPRNSPRSTASPPRSRLGSACLRWLDSSSRRSKGYSGPKQPGPGRRRRPEGGMGGNPLLPLAARSGRKVLTPHERKSGAGPMTGPSPAGAPSSRREHPEACAARCGARRASRGRSRRPPASRSGRARGT